MKRDVKPGRPDEELARLAATASGMKRMDGDLKRSHLAAKDGTRAAGDVSR
jgi:hypothetical protein